MHEVAQTLIGIQRTALTRNSYINYGTTNQPLVLRDTPCDAFYYNLPFFTVIHRNLRQYICNMSAISAISAISVISATSAKPTKLHQFSPQRYQPRLPPLAEPMTIFHAQYGKSLLARLPLAPWRPSRHVRLYYF